MRNCALLKFSSSIAKNAVKSRVLDLSDDHVKGGLKTSSSQRERINKTCSFLTWQKSYGLIPLMLLIFS